MTDAPVEEQTVPLSIRIPKDMMVRLESMAKDRGIGRSVMARHLLGQAMESEGMATALKELVAQARFAHDRLTGIQALLNVALYDLMDKEFLERCRKVRDVIEAKYGLPLT